MDLNKIHQGDTLTVLKQWPDEFVNCVVTSPPYWGLRDYGTAKWVGGNVECGHKKKNRCGGSCSTGHKNDVGIDFYGDFCECGAKRIDDQLGLEKTPEAYVAKMVEVFREIRRVLRKDGTLWLNLGDSYAGNNSRASNNGRAGYGNEREGVFEKTGDGLKPKDLCGIPWRVAFALQADGWWLRQDIIWSKPNVMPESVTDRCTKSHEYIFLLSKSAKYFYDADAVKEEAAYDGRSDEIMKGSEKYNDGYVPNQSEQTMAARGHVRWQKNEDGLRVRNKRSVWTVATHPFAAAHFATFPEKLIEPCILAGCPPGGVVLDPFMGAGTTGLVAVKNGRRYLGIELNSEYVKMAEKRIHNEAGLIAGMI